MSPPPVRVARLVVAYDSAEALRRSACASVHPTWVVDNASRDDTLQTALALGLNVLPLAENQGYGRAIMHGLARLDAELVFIANPDVHMTDESLERLVEASDRYRDADLFAPRLFREDGTEFFRHGDRFDPPARPRRTPDGDACVTRLSGAAMLARRAAFLDHGFDPNIFLYFEDDDLARVWTAAKRPIVFVASAHARHRGDSSSLPSRETEALKALSYGWSLGYVTAKHGLGSVSGQVAAALVKAAGAALTLRPARARRTARVVAGLLRFAAGRRAPGLPQRAPGDGP